MGPDAESKVIRGQQPGIVKGKMGVGHFNRM